jgi:hypothetical protein
MTTVQEILDAHYLGGRVDLNGEVRTASAKQSSPIILPA